MKYLLVSLLALLPLLTNYVLAGEISGFLSDAGQKPVPGATIVLCDTDTGIPVSKAEYKPFTQDSPFNIEGIVTTNTDALGGFIFTDVPKGHYRLIAQSWNGTSLVQNIFKKHSKEIILRGVTGEISVPSQKATNITIRPLGTAVVTIDENFPNNGGFLLISTAAVSTDPILGFVSWRGQFLQNLIGANVMPSGFTKISGLPEGTIHLSVFANDNAGGLGAGCVKAKAGETVMANYIPIVCGWSNGQHTPPKEMEKVYKEVRQIYIKEKKNLLPFFNRILANSGIKVKKPEDSNMTLSIYYPHLQEVVTLPSGQKARFADVLASVKYLELQRQIQIRKAKSKKKI